LTAPFGTLWVVGTPIGNLGDITLRAVETLRSVARIAAEDTRRTRGLLTHLGIEKKPLSSLEAHASERRISALVERLLEGESIALVTDAGMPGVSDPAARVVRAAAAQGVSVRVVPGPSALTAAVALSGLVEGPFRFFGFLPRRGGARAAALASIAEGGEPSVLFEAPGRVQALLDALAANCAERPVALCRELTKLHEQTLYGSAAELAARGEPFRGEVTLVVGAAPRERAAKPLEHDMDESIAAALSRGTSPRTLTDELTRTTGLPRRAVYARVLALRDERKKRPPISK